jgi:hypothetical protein
MVEQCVNDLTRHTPMRIRPGVGCAIPLSTPPILFWNVIPGDGRDARQVEPGRQLFDTSGLGRRDLVADALSNHFALELREREEKIERGRMPRYSFWRTVGYA